MRLCNVICRYEIHVFEYRSRLGMTDEFVRALRNQQRSGTSATDEPKSAYACHFGNQKTIREIQCYHVSAA